MQICFNVVNGLATLIAPGVIRGRRRTSRQRHSVHRPPYRLCGDVGLWYALAHALMESPPSEVRADVPVNLPPRTAHTRFARRVNVYEGPRGPM